MAEPRLLLAGIGNIFLGDDAFGVHVAQQLAAREWPPGVRVEDFGIRGFDLACALVGGYSGAILIDATIRGGTPGTLYVIEPATTDATPRAIDPHTLDPVGVLRFARSLGSVCPWVRVVGCEPLTLGTDDDPATALSEPVARATEEAVSLVETLVGTFLDESERAGGH